VKPVRHSKTWEHEADVILEFSVAASDLIEPSLLTKKNKKKSARIEDLSKRDIAWQSFKDKAVMHSLSPYQPQHNRGAGDEYTPIFLCHAGMYVFADKYGIGCLQELAINRLRRTLSVFRLYPERAVDIVQLVRYGYSHTLDHEPRQDALRGLISEFASCHIGMLSQDGCFKDTLKAEGSFAWDVLQLVLQWWL
jgi:hypothetical protein